MYSRFCQVHFIRPIIGGEPWWAPAKNHQDKQLEKDILKYGEKRHMTAKQVYDRFQKQYNAAEKNLAIAKEKEDTNLIEALNQSIAQATKMMEFTKMVDPTVDPATGNSTQTKWWLPAKNLPNGKLKQAILEYGQQQNMTAKQVYDANQQKIEKIEEATHDLKMNKDRVLIQKLNEQYDLADKIMDFIKSVDPTVDPNYRLRKVKSAHEIHAVQGHEIHLPFKEVPASIIIHDNRLRQFAIINNIDPDSTVVDTLNNYAKLKEFLKSSRLVYRGSLIWNRDSKDADRTTWSDLNMYAYKITKRPLSDMQELQMI